MSKKMIEKDVKIIENRGPKGSQNRHKIDKKDVPKNNRKIIEKCVKDYVKDVKMRRFPSFKNVYR